jgi:transposase
MGILTLTSWQRRRLEWQLRETRDARVFRRTLAVLEVAQGEPVCAVARRLRVTPRVVYYWLGAYTQGHEPDALRDRDRAGRPGLLNQEGRGQLLELLRCSPQDLGYFATEWTLPLLQEQLARSGWHLSEDTLRRELDRLDYSWKRPRYALDPDPEFRGKKAAPPPTDQATATAQRGVGGRRDRPAAVPAVARRLVAPRPGQACGAQRLPPGGRSLGR